MGLVSSSHMVAVYHNHHKSKIQKASILSGLLVHTFGPHTQEAKTGSSLEFKVPGQQGLHREVLLKKRGKPLVKATLFLVLVVGGSSPLFPSLPNTYLYCIDVLSACMSVSCVQCSKRPEEGIRAPRTSVQMVVSCHVGSGIQFQSSGTVCALNCWAIALTPSSIS